jgi:hypothetical protein
MILFLFFEDIKSGLDYLFPFVFVFTFFPFTETVSILMFMIECCVWLLPMTKFYREDWILV